MQTLHVKDFSTEPGILEIKEVLSCREEGQGEQREYPKEVGDE